MQNKVWNQPVFALTALLLFGTATTYAQVEREGNAVTYSGQVLLRIRTGVAGMSAEQRADAVRERLGPILSLENLRADEITVKQTRPYQDATIFVRDRLLITVDKKLAQANGNNEPGALAQQWAERMRTIIPTISVKQQPAPKP